jgi:hypothetical protein
MAGNDEQGGAEGGTDKDRDEITTALWGRRDRGWLMRRGIHCRGGWRYEKRRFAVVSWVQLARARTVEGRNKNKGGNDDNGGDHERVIG